MKTKYKSIVYLFVFLMGVSRLSLAANNDENKAVTGAAVGAGTQVMTTAALDYVTNANGQPEDPNKTILKRAIAGAVTGAVATSATADQKGPSSSNGVSQASSSSDQSMQTNAVKAMNTSSDDDDRYDHGRKHKKHKEHKEHHRPPGWDRGKKTGWGGGDEPPGLEKK